MPTRKAQMRKQKEKEKRERDKSNNVTSSSSPSSQSHLTGSNATSPSPPNPSSPKFNGDGRDEIIALGEGIAERQKKEMEAEKPGHEGVIEAEAETAGPAAQTEEEHTGTDKDEEIAAGAGETGTESAEPPLQGEKEREEEDAAGPPVQRGGEKEEEDAAGPTVQGDEEREVEVNEVEIVEEKKESISRPIEVVTTELAGPACQGFEAVVEREVLELETGKELQVAATENSGNPPENQQPTEVASHVLPFGVAKRATWWNCCGLFDVFSGSGR